jgi:hypothetical protein
VALKTRQPTRRAGFPKILVEGGDKAGKSWSAAELSASPKVGRTAVLILGEDETRWDEYGQIPGARFQIIEHDGKWTSILTAVEDAKAEAAADRAAGKPPFVFVFDQMSAEWDGLNDWAALRARSSKKSKAILAADPDAEIDISPNFHNDKRRRHRALMRHLLTFPGIVILIARGREVTLFENGQPVNGKKTWSVEAEKNLPFDVSAHIRLSRDARPLLVSATGVHCQIRPGIDPARRLPDDWSLEKVIFDMFKLDAKTAEVREFVEFQQELTPEQVRDLALDKTTSLKRIRELWRYTAKAFPAVTLPPKSDGTGDEVQLMEILQRAAKEPRPAGDERQAAVPAAEGARPAPDGHAREAHIALGGSPASAPPAALTPEELEALGDWADAIDSITSEADREVIDPDVDEAENDGRLTAFRAAAIRKAIDAKVAHVSQAAAA